MKETLIPLDIIWVGVDEKVVTIYEDIQPETYPQVFEPSGDALYIIELNAGQVDQNGLKEGDTINVVDYVIELTDEKEATDT